MVRRVIAMSGITETPIINADPARGRLHFFLTDPAVSAFTYCEEGNAVYDPTLDTVFVDRALFQPSELPRVGQALMWERWAPSTFAFSRTFAQLVLLHELGHRQGRSRKSRFDSWLRDPMDDERDADRFAVEKFRLAVIRGDGFADDDVISEVREAGIDSSLPIESQLVASLLFATSQMSVGLLFAKGRFSSLSSDERHPSYGTRARGISEALRAGAADDPVLSKYLDYFDASTARVDALRTLPFIEVYGMGPVADATLTDEGVAIVDRDWRLWVAVLPESSSTPRAPARVAATMVAQLQPPDGSALVNAMWSQPNEGVFVWTGSTLFQYDHGVVTQRGDISALISSAGVGARISTVEPSPWVVFDIGPRIVVIGERGASRTVDWTNILATARKHQVRNPTVRTVTLSPGGDLRAAIDDAHGPLKGALIYPLASASPARYVPLVVGNGVDAYGELAILDIDGIERFLLVGKTDLDSDVFVWELFEDRPPILRNTYSPLLRRLSGLPDSGQNVPVVVTGVHPTRDDRLLISLAADSILSYNIRTGAMSPVFHPSTSTSVDVRGSALMFTAFNGYKLYVLPR